MNNDKLKTALGAVLQQQLNDPYRDSSFGVFKKMSSKRNGGVY